MICGANVEAEKNTEGAKSYNRHLFSYRNALKQRCTLQASKVYFSFLTSNSRSVSSGFQDTIPTIFRQASVSDPMLIGFFSMLIGFFLMLIGFSLLKHSSFLLLFLFATDAIQTHRFITNKCRCPPRLPVSLLCSARRINFTF